MIGSRPVLDGRYELGEPLGTGGMAVVRRARDIRLGREVAVKLLRPEVAQDEDAMSAFRAEAMSAARLNHPGVVAVHDVGEAEIDGALRPFLVMEMIEGQPLSHLLVDGTPLTVERALEIAVDVTGALAHAHERGLVHRDVTPANLMVLRDNSVKVTDFGIARAAPAVGVEGSEAGAAYGSIAYVSPEQARRGTVDARSDLYSVGCLLMTMLTGYPPFRGSSEDVVRHHLRTRPPTPSSRRPGLEQALDEIVLRSLEKDPWRRPQSASEMRRDLLQVLGTIDAPAAWAAGAHGLASAVAPHEPLRGSDITELPTARVGSQLLPDGALFDDQDLGGTGYLPLPGTDLPGAVTDERGPGPFAPGEDPPGSPAPAASSGAGAPGAPPAARTGSTVMPARVGPPRQGWNRASSAWLAAAVAVVLLVVLAIVQWPDGVEDSSAVSPADVSVPSTANLTVEQASAILSDVGLIVGDSRPVFSLDVPRGAVIGTEPASGESVPAGTEVDLVISSGPEQTTVPNMVALSLGDARSALDEVNLRVGTTLEVPASVARSTVLSSNPAFGEVVAEGTVVELVVASGSNLVPPVAGLPLGSARGSLEDEGFVVQVEEVDSDDPAGVVLEVQPAAASEQRVGTTVTIVVSTGPPTPDVTETTTSTATATATSTATTLSTATTTATETVAVPGPTQTETRTVTQPPAPAPAPPAQPTAP